MAKGRKRFVQYSAKPQVNPNFFRGGFTVDCPSGKKGYENRQQARDAAKVLHQTGRTKERLSAYKCPEPLCRYFHLGNLPEDVRLGEITRDQLTTKAQWERMTTAERKKVRDEIDARRKNREKDSSES